MNRTTRMILSCACLGVCACSGSVGDGKNAGGAKSDADSVDAALGDGATSDASSQDSSPQDAFSDVFSGNASLADWVIRKPKSVQCKLIEKDPMFPDEGDYREEFQTDLVCTYHHNGVEGLIYVQDTPLECRQSAVLGRWVTKSRIDLALIKVGDQVDYLENTFYEYGGQHQTDRLTFDYHGVKFVYDHVCSIGNNMAYSSPHPDCAMIKDMNGKMVDNGCIETRAHPIVCKPVDKNGNYDETMKDEYRYQCGAE